MMKLIYHPPIQTSEAVSPFDAAIMEMVAGKHVSIACPYLGVEYLNRVIANAKSWQLLTDVTAWLQSHGLTARPGIVEFILKHSDLIHHCENLHAKVVLTDVTALFGSANFTMSGVTKNTELGVLIDSAEHVAELRMWFDSIWLGTRVVDHAELSNLAQGLPSKPPVLHPSLSSPYPAVRSHLSQPLSRTVRPRDYPKVETLLARHSAEVQKYARQLLGIMGEHADDVRTTHSNGDDIRFYYQQNLFAEIVFARSWLTLVLTVPVGSISDTEFKWNTPSRQSRLDRGRIKLRVNTPVPDKVRGWIRIAIEYSRR